MNLTDMERLSAPPDTDLSGGYDVKSIKEI